MVKTTLCVPTLTGEIELDGSKIHIINPIFIRMLKSFDRLCCTIVRTWLVPRAEGTAVPVPSMTLNWINAHVSCCNRCKIELKNLRLTTFALKKAAQRSTQRNFDPYFADRVIQRVQRENKARKRNVAQLKLVCAGSSMILTFGIVIGYLGGFNSLRAEIFGEPHSAPIIGHQAPALSPFPNHDPFATPVSVTSEITEPHSSIPQMSVVKTVLPQAASAPARPPVQDYLSHVLLQHAPELAGSSYQSQDKSTTPAIITSTTGSNGLSISIPPPAAPNTEQAQSQPSSLPTGQLTNPVPEQGATVENANTTLPIRGYGQPAVPSENLPGGTEAK